MASWNWNAGPSRHDVADLDLDLDLEVEALFSQGMSGASGGGLGPGNWLGGGGGSNTAAVGGSFPRIGGAVGGGGGSVSGGFGNPGGIMGGGINSSFGNGTEAGAVSNNSNDSSSSFFDPFASMGFFNPEDPAGNLSIQQTQNAAPEWEMVASGGVGQGNLSGRSNIDYASVFGSDDSQINGRGISHFGNGSNNGNNFYQQYQDQRRDHDGPSQGVRQTGIIHKLFPTFGFIYSGKRQHFFHIGEFEGAIEHLKLGDPVAFEKAFDEKSRREIAGAVIKIGSEVLSDESQRVFGAVAAELEQESNGVLQGRIIYENRGECYFLPYVLEDIEGNVTPRAGDTVSFQLAAKPRSGNLTAKFIRLEVPPMPVRYKGIVSYIKDKYGFIERADVAKDIFFHFSDTKKHEGIVIGDNVEFDIQPRYAKQVARKITKLPPGTVVFEDVGSDIWKGQVLKPIEKSKTSTFPASGWMQGRLRYLGPDQWELEVGFGEKNGKGSFTMIRGDWVQFQLAVDRRDKQQRATNIALMDESFILSGERREEGVISAVQPKVSSGYITCAERDYEMYFRFSEMLDVTRPPKIGDDVEFTLIHDSTCPTRQTGVRIKYLKPGAVQFEISVIQGINGIVVQMPSTPWTPSQEALSGLIQYQLHGFLQDIITFQRKDSQNLNNIQVGTKVIFDIHQIRRNRELVAANVRAPDDIDSNDGESTPVVYQNPAAPHHLALQGEGGMSFQQLAGAGISSYLSGYQFSMEHHAIDGAPIDSADSKEGNLQQDHFGASGSELLFNGMNRYDQFNNSEDNHLQPRVAMKGHISSLKKGFGFIETLAQDGEIFFHFGSLVGDFSTLQVGQEVKYILSYNGNRAANLVEPLPNGSIGRAAIFPDILQGVVSRPIRGANSDQSEYAGVIIDGQDGHSYNFGIISMLNKKETLQAGEVVEFQLDAQGKPVNIRALRKKFRGTVETVKGHHGFLFSNEDGKKFSFHIQSEVKDHQRLNPGDQVEFSILQNTRNGKSFACSVVRIGKGQRLERLLNRMSKLSVDEASPRSLVVRQPFGPDGTKGFTQNYNKT